MRYYKLLKTPTEAQRQIARSIALGACPEVLRNIPLEEAGELVRHLMLSTEDKVLVYSLAEDVIDYLSDEAATGISTYLIWALDYAVMLMEADGLSQEEIKERLSMLEAETLNLDADHSK